MAYATLQDLIDRYGEAELIHLTDRADPPAGAVDETVAAKALADADQTINGYTGGRYRVPLAPVPDLIVRLACDLARHYLARDLPSEAVVAAHKEALRTLDRIAAGVVVLQAAGVAAPAAGDSVMVEAPERQFTGATLKGF